MARTQGSHSDVTGPRIRSLALRLFARRGYAAVSMRQIASDVGVQVGALYNYTPNKQSLLFNLMKGHMEELLLAWERHDESGTGALAVLEKFTRFHIRFHSERPDEVFVSYMELRNLSEENFAVIERLRGEYENRLIDILASGVKEEIFDVHDTRITAMAIIAMLTGVNTWFRADGRLTLPQVENMYCDMVRGMVSARENF